MRSQQRSQQYAADAQGVFKSNAQVPTKPGCEELGNAGQIEIKPLPNWVCIKISVRARSDSNLNKSQDLLSEDENSSNEEYHRPVVRQLETDLEISAIGLFSLSCSVNESNGQKSNLN